LHSAVVEEPQPAEGISAAGAATLAPAEVEHLQAENEQLRALCQELEQALQEATQHLQPDLEQQIREYDAVLEEKNEMIRQLHQQMQEAQAALEAKASQLALPPPRQHQGPVPCEDELLALSEELERERRQLQEDEQTLMQQMREMEVGMARERAELARQRNDLQRLQAEIRHDLERLERNGAVQSKIENLKIKLQDATARRGAAPGPTGASSGQASSPGRKEGLMGRLFGQGK
jgi:chromosome segregation ATPase